MTPIRPNAFPTQPVTTSIAGAAADAARVAAQRAFFDAAMGRAAGPAAAAAPQAAAFTPQTAPVQRAEICPTAMPDEPPAKLRWPGSLLDIRVWTRSERGAQGLKTTSLFLNRERRLHIGV